jgi:hypothetical protein
MDDLFVNIGYLVAGSIVLFIACVAAIITVTVWFMTRD